jgi:hypothetical protein
MWHNFTIFLMTLVDLVARNFVIQKLFLLIVFFFFPLLNMSFQGFSNVATSCYWTFIVILTFPISSPTFLWTLILTWQSLIVFPPLLPIVHGSLSKSDVSQTSWWSPLLSPLNYQLNLFSQLLFEHSNLFSHLLFNCCFIVAFLSIVVQLLPFFQQLLPLSPQLQPYCLFFNHWTIATLLLSALMIDV